MTEELFQMAGGITAQFITDTPIELTEIDRMHLRAHLPGIQPASSLSAASDVYIEHRESPQASLTQKASQVRLYDHWGGKLSADFSHLIYGAARHAWLSKGIMPIHAACVGNDKDGYVLLVGHSGAGKTSTTLQCAHTGGMQVFSGDKTLLQIDASGAMKAVGGTKVMTIKAEDKRRWPHLKDQGLLYGDRLLFELNPEQYAQLAEVPIKAIAIVQLNDGVTQCNKLTPLSALHNLYPHAMDIERADVVVAGGRAVFDGAISSEIKTQLTRALNKSLQEIPTFKLMGSRERIASMVNAISQADKKTLETIEQQLGGRQL